MTENQRTIGKYQIQQRLGSGGFATVWLCLDPVLDAQVAVKVLGDIWCTDADVEARFLQEARLLFKLNDPRVVKVHTTGEREDGCPYFVMDYADRGNLQERMDARREANQPYAVEEALRLSRDIADCLTVVHAAGIVHRDLKPSNVLYHSDDAAANGERMMLGDFGVARPLDAASANTIVTGSPYYMAPEQADEATAASVDQRADIYSAAVILYELLGGRVPYPFSTVSEIRRAQETDQRIPLAQLRANVPATVAWLVDQGLRTNRAERISSAEAWITALDTAIAGLADTSSPNPVAVDITAGGDTINIANGGGPVVVPTSAPETDGAGTRTGNAVAADPVPAPAAPELSQQPIQPPLTPAPSRKRRWVRRLLWLIVIILLIAVAAAVASYLTGWPSDINW
jgi:serine/threonine protein kinase